MSSSMSELMSNHLKAIMVPDDITAGEVSLPREQCYVVQHFDYKCERARNENSDPFGSTLSVILSTSIKMTSVDAGKVFFERLKQNSHFPFSFMFNATFDSDKKLNDYGGGMVVYGYVVDVDESHNYIQSQSGKEQQLIIRFNVLVSSITYLGNDGNKSLNILRNSD